MAREAAATNEQALLWGLQGAAIHQPDIDNDEEDLIQDILAFAWQQLEPAPEGLGLLGAAASVSMSTPGCWPRCVTVCPRARHWSGLVQWWWGP